MEMAEILYCSKVPVVIKHAVSNHAQRHSNSSRPPLGKLLSANLNSAPKSQQTWSGSSKSNTVQKENLPSPEITDSDKSAQETASSYKVLQEHHNPGLRIQISQITIGPSRQKVLHFEITDDEDPFFLCELEIAEEDYPLLKQDQNLLVDFQQFPHKVVELLELCIKSQHSNKEPRSPVRNDVQSPARVSFNLSAANFVAQLIRDDSKQFVKLDIIETNTFKQMSHLSLSLALGNDASIKQYLARLVQSGRQELSSTKGQLEYTTETLTTRVSELQSTVGRLNGELERSRLNQSEKLGHLQMQHATELAQVQERTTREREALRQELEKKERSTETKFEKEIQELTLKNTHLTTTHSHLLAHNQTLEANLSNVKSRLSDIEKDYASLKSDHERVLAESRSAARGRLEGEKMIEELRNRLTTLDTELRTLTNEKRTGDEAFKLEQVKRRKAEDTLALQESKARTLEETLMTARADVNKGNDIIRRLQTELKESKEKSKLKNTITYQQEVLLEERAQIIEDYKAEIESARKKLDQSIADKDTAVRELEAVQAKLQTSQHVIQDNNNVIEWLHKQLNQSAALSFPLRSSAAPPSSSRTVAEKYTGRKWEGEDPSPASKYLHNGDALPAVARPFQSGLAGNSKLGNTAADILAYKRRPTSPNRPAPASASTSFIGSKTFLYSKDSAAESVVSRTSASSGGMDSTGNKIGNVSGISAPGKKYGITFGETPRRSANTVDNNASNRAVASKSNYF